MAAIRHILAYPFRKTHKDINYIGNHTADQQGKDCAENSFAITARMGNT